MQLIVRKKYLDELIELYGTPDIKVITGIRRSGKSGIAARVCYILAVNSIYAKGIYDIYITGSNAFLLSSDLATLFTGRTMEIKVYPFSFMEYLTYYEITDGYDDAFDQYVRTGGMPGAYVYKTEDRQYDYVRDVYSTILVRDLVEKYKIRNKSEFTNISEFMMDNIGNLTFSK